MQSNILEMFQTFIDESVAKQLAATTEEPETEQPDVEQICSEEITQEGELVTNASFVYSILNGDAENQHLTVDVDDYSTENLEHLACLLAPMSHPQFFYLVMTKVQQDFQAEDREEDFMYLMSEVEKKKAEFESNMGDPYITPLELSRRESNE